FNTPPAAQFLFNERFGILMTTAACFGAAVFMARQDRDHQKDGERPLYAVLAVATNIIALWAISAEASDYFAPRLGYQFQNVRLTAVLAQQLALSLIWTIYATALIVLGVACREAG